MPSRVSGDEMKFEALAKYWRLCVQFLAVKLGFREVEFKRKLMLYVYGACIWPTIRGGQQRSLCAFHQKESSRSFSDSRDSWPDIDFREELRWRSAYTAISSRSSSSKVSRRAEGLRYGLLPPMPLIGVIYYSCSTLVHTVYFFYSITFFDRIVDETGAHEFYSCYLPRVVLSEHLDQKLAVQIGYTWSTVLLLYRFMMFGPLRRSNGFDMVEFLLVDEEVLEKIRLNVRTHPSEHDNNDSRSLADTEAKLFARIRHNLFYWCQHTGQYLPRPNRTISSYRKLAKAIELGYTLTLVSCLLMLGFVALDGTRVLLLNQGKLFPGCKIVLFSGAYFIRVAGTFSIGIIQIIDTILFLGFGISLTLYITMDQLCYWRHIDAKMEHVRRTLPRVTLLDIYSETRTTIDHRSVEAKYSKLAPPPSEGNNEERLHLVRTAGYNFELERDLKKLQRYLTDFFHQLGHVNNSMSGLISFVMFVWLALNVSYTLTGVQVDTSLRIIDQVIIRMIQFSGLFMAAVVSLFLLRLKNSTELAYVKLCSIAAYDQRLEKTDWLKILNYYSEKPEYAFIYLNGQIFSRLSFLKILSYTITFIFVVEGMQAARRWDE